MGSPYKMKGSPMQRNFGIGSPLMEKKEIDPPPTTKEANTGSVENVPGGTKTSLIERDAKAESVEILKKGQTTKEKLEIVYPGTTWGKVKTSGNPNGIWMTSDGRKRGDM